MPLGTLPCPATQEEDVHPALIEKWAFALNVFVFS